MATIYRKAHLTIAATRSTCAAGGLHTATPDFEVSGTSSTGEKYSLYFREKVDHHIDNANGRDANEHEADAYRPTIDRHLLLTRAWGFQERLLSTRVLHFGPYELFFECRTGIECECSGIAYYGSSDAIPSVLTNLVHADALANYALRIQLPRGSGPAQNWMARLWRTLVSTYTGLDITKHQDRLPAIGGLASNMRNRKASAYLAGLWMDSLNDDLLWHVISLADAKPRPSLRSAPSWSWASVEMNTSTMSFDEILMWHPDLWILESMRMDERAPNHLSDVVSCMVVPDGVDEFGLISRGTLKVSDAVAEGILERQVEVHGDRSNIVHHVAFPNVRHPMKPDYLLDHPGTAQVMPGTKVLCLRMSVVREGHAEVLVSLVLRPSSPGAVVYERIGTLLIYARPPPPVDVNGGIYESTSVQVVTIE